MCTVTLVPAGAGLRVMCNRDERHGRPAAHPPFISKVGGGLAIMPLDPQGGGTWIAANAAGLVFAILNAQGGPGAPATSRGRLILEMLDCTTLREAIARARALCWRNWPPHRLVVSDARRVLELRLGAAGLSMHACGLHRPLAFTSSSLGDALVESVRGELFDELVTSAGDPLGGQDAFHHHRWPDRPHLSVHMHRHDAGTQSITTVDVTRDRVRMVYEPTREVVGIPAGLTIERSARDVGVAGTATSAPTHADAPGVLAAVSS